MLEMRAATCRGAAGPPVPLARRSGRAEATAGAEPTPAGAPVSVTAGAEPTTADAPVARGGVELPVAAARVAGVAATPGLATAGGATPATESRLLPANAAV